MDLYTYIWTYIPIYGPIYLYMDLYDNMKSGGTYTSQPQGERKRKPKVSRMQELQVQLKVQESTPSTSESRIHELKV